MIDIPEVLCYIRYTNTNIQLFFTPPNDNGETPNEAGSQEEEPKTKAEPASDENNMLHKTLMKY